MRSELGLGLVDLMAALAVAGLALGTALPALGEHGAAVATSAGARLLATEVQALRWNSVARGAAHGMLFERDTRGWYWFEVRDGNGNGLRVGDVRSGVDPTLSGPHRLENSVRGITPGFPPGERAIPRIPPASGTIDNLDDPIRIGRSDLLSFTPLGTSSTGTIYLTDGKRQLYALVLYGRTGRLRVWRFDARRRSWTL